MGMRSDRRTILRRRLEGWWGWWNVESVSWRSSSSILMCLAGGFDVVKELLMREKVEVRRVRRALRRRVPMMGCIEVGFRCSVALLASLSSKAHLTPKRWVTKRYQS